MAPRAAESGTVLLLSGSFHAPHSGKNWKSSATGTDGEEKEGQIMSCSINMMLCAMMVSN